MEKTTKSKNTTFFSYPSLHDCHPMFRTSSWSNRPEVSRGNCSLNGHSDPWAQSLRVCMSLLWREWWCYHGPKQLHSGHTLKQKEQNKTKQKNIRDQFYFFNLLRVQLQQTWKTKQNKKRINITHMDRVTNHTLHQSVLFFILCVHHNTVY